MNRLTTIVCLAALAAAAARAGETTAVSRVAQPAPAITAMVVATSGGTALVARAGTPPGRVPGDPKNTPIQVYVDREGWQSGVGYKGMVHYTERLSNHLSKNVPGYIQGIAGGKKGILLMVTFKAQRNFYLAQENTKEFLTAMVEDLAQRLPEPVAPQVTVTHNGKEIIRAERVGDEITVKFLL